MKTLKEIAVAILERRQRPNPTIMQGEMIETLGPDGFGTAIERRWLVPSYESGFLQVTPDQTLVEEIIATAALPDPVPVPVEDSLSHGIVLEHAHRNRYEATLRLDEIAAPATGKPAPSFRTTPAPSPNAPPPATSAPGQPRAVGSDVAVVEGGKSFVGKVMKAENGRYKISFGGPERPAQDRDYEDSELQAVQTQ